MAMRWLLQRGSLSLVALALSGCGDATQGPLCVAEGTVVETPNGPTRVEHLSVGDEV